MMLRVVKTLLHERFREVSLALSRETPVEPVVAGCDSKQMLTPHPIPPPHTFTPFLNPPKISTSQNTKTQSTSQKPIQKSRNKATHQNQYNDLKHKLKTQSA